ncbi:uncharacterized protein METZ01_LOCUS364993 [marine metagenome]|uniref:Secretion system C-terminal sorting domain-containing protein n=1 Tax=marine metagenome TaxID=408172 RepID=A0A382SQE0_9ZZZZ
MRLLSCISFLSLVLALDPGWVDIPGDYQFTASMTAIVYINGGVMGDTEDILAAFDASENVRGISTMVDGLGSYDGQILHAITIRSNAVGDIISFRYYDASADIVYDLPESYTFVNNDLVGNLMTPYNLNPGEMVINDGLLPLDYVLEQNYPNPFNPKTFINYAVTELSNVSLRIYDIKGQFISELLNNIHMPGKYKTVWDSGHLATGIYFLEMNVYSRNDQLIFTGINKMMYLK